jgi:hypothetical protein
VPSSIAQKQTCAVAHGLEWRWSIDLQVHVEDLQSYSSLFTAFTEK